MLDDLDGHLDSLENDPEIRALVLTGAGERAFTAGADINHMREATPLEARQYARRGHAVTNRLENFPKPVIAAVNGYALGGGCELALACDIRLASEKAQFGLPEVNIGILPGWGGTQRMARATSPGFAKELIFTGRRVDAAEARATGLANHVYPHDELMDRAVALAEEIATKPPGDRRGEGGGQPRARGRPSGAPRARARRVRPGLHHRGSARGHGRLLREAHAGVPRALTGVTRGVGAPPPGMPTR